jgi:hypothetical protein
MDPKIQIEVAGLTSLDQMELEEQDQLKQARFLPEETPSGRLGQLPTVTMALEVTKIVAPSAIAALAVWLAKTKREVRVRLQRESTPDGGKKESIEIHVRSSKDYKSELIEAVKHLTEK